MCSLFKRKKSVSSGFKVIRCRWKTNDQWNRKNEDFSFYVSFLLERIDVGLL